MTIKARLTIAVVLLLAAVTALIGFIVVVLVGRAPRARHARAFAATGFLGAYTTFSTFAVETDVLVKGGHAAVAVAYLAASLVAGITVAWLGVLLGRAVVDRSSTPEDVR